MKKMQGLIDPISLTVALILGIATVGMIAAPDATDQPVAQDSSAEVTGTTDKLVAEK